jgi:hypothetical protein
MRRPANGAADVKAGLVALEQLRRAAEAANVILDGRLAVMLNVPLRVTRILSHFRVISSEPCYVSSSAVVRLMDGRVCSQILWSL